MAAYITRIARSGSGFRSGNSARLLLQGLVVPDQTSLGDVGDANLPQSLANVVLRLIGFLVLIPWLGLLGAAISATVSLALATIALNVLCRRRTGVDPSILVLSRFSSSKAGAYAVRVADPND